MEEPIKVQVGKIFMNKTRKYLYPLIKLYGEDFTYRMNSLFKVAVGIGDIVVERCGFKHEKHLFILVDSKYKPALFVRTLQKLREHSSFEDDYVFGNVKTSRFHMIVIKVPEKYISSLEMFKENQFSKMYSQQDIQKLFSYEMRTGSDKDIYESAYKVLIHDHNYKVQFAEQIRKEFDVPFGASDIGNEVEFDLPIKRIAEIFNYKPEPNEDLEI